MTAPTVALVAAPFRPTNICGSAAGARIRQNIVHGSAPVEREKWTRSMDSERKASMPFSRIGKKHTMKTMIIFGGKPKPNHVTKIGAKAIFGAISSATADGYSVRSRKGEKATSIERGTPITTAMV